MNHAEKILPLSLNTENRGELTERVEKLYAILESCELCPRRCRVNRLKGERGICQSGSELEISSYGPHFGEEEPLVGLVGGGLLMAHLLNVSPAGGSGTVFLSHCNLLCVFCQNYDISHGKNGYRVSSSRLADIMIQLQESGCHNINFVSPSHYTPQIVKAIQRAISRGLKIPIVWNCGGYENKEVIQLLEGIVDIYMPDFKFGKTESAEKFCRAPDYYERCCEAVREMHRQVGDLKLDSRGIAQRGLLIRHLVMPDNLAGSEKVLRFIVQQISPRSYVNIMSQYRPEGKARLYPELNRCPSADEFDRVIHFAQKIGLNRGFQKKHLNRF